MCVYLCACVHMGAHARTRPGMHACDCVCVIVCMCVRVCRLERDLVCMHVLYLCVWACANTCTGTDMHAYKHACMHTRSSCVLCMLACMYVCMYACLQKKDNHTMFYRVLAHTLTNIQTYTRKRAYMHTYIHTHYSGLQFAVKPSRQIPASVIAASWSIWWLKYVYVRMHACL